MIDRPKIYAHANLLRPAQHTHRHVDYQCPNLTPMSRLNPPQCSIPTQERSPDTWNRFSTQQPKWRSPQSTDREPLVQWMGIPISQSAPHPQLARETGREARGES